MKDRGEFREDLYFRLVHKIAIPPLRERYEDLPLLVKHMLKKFSQVLKKKKPAVPRELYQLLRIYHFPGNIRELETLIKNALSVHKEKTLSLSTIKTYIREHNTRTPIRLVNNQGKDRSFSYSGAFPTLEEMTEFLVKEAMVKAGGEKSIAAALLGISPYALHRKLKDSETNPN